MRKVRWETLFFVLMITFTFFLPGLVGAQQKVIELTYGTTYGPDHTFSLADKAWMAKIEKETNGRVRIKPYWGGTLFAGKGGGMDELQAHVVDIAMIMPSYSRSGYDICKAMYLFTIGANQETGRRILNELRAKFPEIDKEYAALKVLAYTSGVDYDLLTRKPVRKVEDLKGLRLKITADFAPAMKEMGADPVKAPMPETYPMVQKNILDGLLGAREGLKSFRFAEVCKYYTFIGLYRTHNGSRAMNLEAWKKLPPDIQKIFNDNIEWWGQENDRLFEQTHKDGVEFGKQQKVEFITLPKAELAKFYAAFSGSADKIAKELDAKGLPGTKIYQEAQALVKKYSK